ncbi:hypothetical protein TNIN_142251 [Trichonephila inaurata madagascariensis]|uniref:Uncharacterized protein n=1 Tax=Trichonephila inaurata madagascariensis TaxID=2747483 RepID=A0A8X6JYF4_9ARAC|nr:hypothetical protein TNIN_78961 [Trichonephila inaurata madagascariensis]GFY42937.1 hypothetical protein TNIN_142251 [Trichonephila inaurata madagascariensis]
MVTVKLICCISSHGMNTRTSRAYFNKQKTARVTILDPPTTFHIENQYFLLPNVVTKQISGLQTPPITTDTTPNVTANQQPRQNNTSLPPPLMLNVTDDYEYK